MSERRREIVAGAPRIAVVLWSGNLGGAEIATLTLARFLRAEGVIVNPVFVGDTGIIGTRFERAGFPVVSLGATPGSKILLAPHRAAAVVRAAGRDGAILVSGGILALALRAGGYRGRLVAIEHGGIAQIEAMSIGQQLRALSNWSSGARMVDVFVGVSRFVVDQVIRHSPGCRAVHIPNGIDTEEFAPRRDRVSRSALRPIVVGCAGRLINGKGFEDALDAAARVASQVPLTIRIAGDGPLRTELESRFQSTTPALTVEFVGWCASMPEFWNTCDVAVVPTSKLAEGFGMTALEALSCGLPVIATNSGGLPEVVADGQCGSIYPAGDVPGLCGALLQLVNNTGLRCIMGQAARARVLRYFDARVVARAHVDLLKEIEHHVLR